MTLVRADIAAAVRAFDPVDLAARRWFLHKGEVPSSVRLAHAFPLSESAVIALVDLRVGDGSGHLERYAIPFVRDPADGTVREADAGDGAWRALAVAIAEGRTIPALSRAPGRIRPLLRMCA